MTALAKAHADLKSGAPGIATLRRFQRECETCIEQAPDEAGVLRLLAGLTGRFIDLYDDQPLEVATAQAVHDRLLALVDRAGSVDRAEDKLTLVNELGRLELG